MLTPVPNAQVIFNRGALGVLTDMGNLILVFGNKSFMRRVTHDEYQSMLHSQLTFPVWVADAEGQRYWWYRSVFYWEAVGLDPNQVYALIVAAEQEQRRQQRRQIERAQAMVAQGPQDSTPRRGHISTEVRNYIFQRDGGQCAVCASKVELQFDHIIPVALGGSSEPENLQILCGPCNRQKGASLG